MCPAIGIGISPMLSRNSGGGVIPPTSSNLIVQNWIDKITLDGYEYPSQAKVDIYTTAFDYGDAQGITTNLDFLSLFKVENQNLCKIPFIHSAGSSTRLDLIGGNLIFDSTQGIKSNNADSYIDSKFVEADGVNYQLGNGCFGVYATTSVNASTKDAMGTTDNTLGTESIIVNTTGGSYATDQQSYSTFSFGSNVGVTALITSVLNSNFLSLYESGILVDSNAAAEDYQLSNYSFNILNTNFDGTSVDGTAFYNNYIKVSLAGIGSIDQVKLNTFVNLLLL